MYPLHLIDGQVNSTEPPDGHVRLIPGHRWDPPNSQQECVILGSIED